MAPLVLAGPYVDIRVTDSENVEYNLDAVFLSPHKFVGAAGGTPGVLVAKRRLFSNDIPTFAGGGTVKYTLMPYSHDDDETHDVCCYSIIPPDMHQRSSSSA